MPAALSSPATADEQASCGERGGALVRRAMHLRGRFVSWLKKLCTHN